MATEKVSSIKFVFGCSRWQLGIRVIVLAIVLAAIAVLVGKDMGRLETAEQSRPLPFIQPVRLRTIGQNLARTDSLPPDVENAIRQSILSRF